MKEDKQLYHDMEKTFLTEEIQAQQIIGPMQQRILALFVSSSKKLQVKIVLVLEERLSFLFEMKKNNHFECPSRFYLQL